MQNPAAERACIASVVQHGADAYIEMSDILKFDRFDDGVNSLLWQCIDNVFSKDLNRTFDWHTLMSSAKELGIEGMVKAEKDYLKSLKNCRCDIENTRAHAIAVFKSWMIRELRNRAGQSDDGLEKLSGAETVDAIITTAESPILEFTNTLNTDQEDPLMGAGAYDYLKHLGENPRDMIGISTGYPIYDMLIGGGLQRGDANFIAARAKKGKSSIADNSCKHIAGTLRIPVLQIDTEMKKERHQIRIVSNMTGVPMNDIKSGKYYQNSYQQEDVLQAANVLNEMPFYYKNVAGMAFSDIISYIRRWIIKDVGLDENGKTNDCVIVYDYFKLCNTEGLKGGMQEHQLLGFQLMELVNLIVKYDVSCLCFAQQNRAGIDDDTTNTIAGSDRILMYCGSLSLFQAKTPEEVAEDGPENGTRKLKVLETRDGTPNDHNDWVNFQFNGAINRIKEIGLRSQQNQNRAVQTNGFDDSEPLNPES